MVEIRQVIERARGVLGVLKVARISAGLVALGCAALSLDQGLDVVRALVEDANLHIHVKGMSGQGWWLVLFQWTAFIIACVWSGLNAWYWPRVLYRLVTPTPAPQWLKLSLRFLGLVPIGAASAAIVMVARSDGGPGLREVSIGLSACIIATIALAIFFIHREGLFSHRKRWFNRPSRLLDSRRRDVRGEYDPRLTQGDDAFFLVSFVMGAALVGALCMPGVRAPTAILFGSAALAFAAIGILIALLSLLAWMFGRIRLPVAPVLLLTFAAFSCVNDNHNVRVLEGRADPERMPDIGVALAQWERVNPDPNAPLILVASAGGASRAGYWTGAVLRALDDRTNGLFGARVFAISAVSGGALGAVGYAARLADVGGAGPGRCYDGAGAAAFDKAFLGGDYLAPVVGGLLYPDLFQRFFPLPWFPDRATALEEGWERGWRRAAAEPEVVHSNCAPRAGSNRMTDEYRQIWEGSLFGKGGWVPLVLVNGTLVENGKRVITAPIRINSQIFEDSYSFYDLVKRPLRASTAILNGARFPIVSPAGTLDGGKSPRGRVVDGGYFENGGVETLLDLARTLHVARPDRRILLIEIDNSQPDETKPLPGDLERYANGVGPRDLIFKPLEVEPAPYTGAPAFSEVTSIIGGLYATRTSRGVLAAKRLSGLSANGLGKGVSRVTFELPRLGRGTTLSWSLSLTSRARMDRLLALNGGDSSAAVDRPLILCQRAAADAIKTLVDGGAPAIVPGCRTATLAAAVGFPLQGVPASTP